MDKREAKELLDSELGKYRTRPYEELLPLRGEPDVYSFVGPSGKRYQVEVQAFWDSGRPGNLRVMASIDDGGLSAFRPLCKDFIIAPDGTFIGGSSGAS